MIDLNKEAVFSLSDATRKLPRRRGGKRPHVATLHRWASRGLRGRRLEIIQVGGTACTSLEALERFFRSLSSPDTTSVPLARRQSAGAIDRALDFEGLTEEARSERAH